MVLCDDIIVLLTDSNSPPLQYLLTGDGIYWPMTILLWPVYYLLIDSGIWLTDGTNLLYLCITVLQ